MGVPKRNVGRLRELPAETNTCRGSTREWEKNGGSSRLGKHLQREHPRGGTKWRELLPRLTCLAGAPAQVNILGGSTRAVEAPGRELPGLWREHPDGNMTGASAPTSGAPSEDSREHPCQWAGASATQSGSSRTCIGSMGGSFRHPLQELHGSSHTSLYHSWRGLPSLVVNNSRAVKELLMPLNVAC
ncbi:hypothetical protein FB451DRAFT_1175529 [Mycena latifolia]|nr:hypothetical protein FB451DRAFT_1175529 [Mycena latifolia]